MISSMTGFASGSGECLPFSWSWELRSVNAKGLDMRLRVPDWLDGLEVALRSELSKALARGNVTLSLRLTRAEESATLSLNTEMMSGVLDLIRIASLSHEFRACFSLNIMLSLPLTLYHFGILMLILPTPSAPIV